MTKKKKSFLSNPDCPLPFAFLLELFFQLGDVRTCVFQEFCTELYITRLQWRIKCPKPELFSSKAETSLVWKFRGRWVVNLGEMRNGLGNCREEPEDMFPRGSKVRLGISMAGLVFFCPQSTFPPFYGGIFRRLCSDMEHPVWWGSIHFTHVEQIWQT